MAVRDQVPDEMPDSFDVDEFNPSRYELECLYCGNTQMEGWDVDHALFFCSERCVKAAGHSMASATRTEDREDKTSEDVLDLPRRS